MSNRQIKSRGLPGPQFGCIKCWTKLLAMANSIMRTSLVIAHIIISCGVVAISFALCIYFIVGDCSETIKMDMIRLFLSMKGAPYQTVLLCN